MSLLLEVQGSFSELLLDSFRFEDEDEDDYNHEMFEMLSIARA